MRKLSKNIPDVINWIELKMAHTRSGTPVEVEEMPSVKWNGDDYVADDGSQQQHQETQLRQDSDQYLVRVE